MIFFIKTLWSSVAKRRNHFYSPWLKSKMRLVKRWERHKGFESFYSDHCFKKGKNLRNGLVYNGDLIISVNHLTSAKSFFIDYKASQHSSVIWIWSTSFSLLSLSPSSAYCSCIMQQEITAGLWSNSLQQKVENQLWRYMLPVWRLYQIFWQHYTFFFE